MAKIAYNKGMKQQKDTSNLPVLTEERKNFVNIYLLTFNVRRAAKKCGVTRMTANNWLHRPEVKTEIQRRSALVAQECDVTVSECMNELARIAFFNYKDCIKNFKVDPESGDLGMTLDDWEDMDTSALQEIACRVNAQGIPYVTIKPYDKVAALKEILNRLDGIKDENHLHLHLTKEELKGKSAQEVSSAYQQMVRQNG